MQRPLLLMRGQLLWRSSADGSVNRFHSGAGMQMISKHLRNTSAMLSESPAAALGLARANRAGLPWYAANDITECMVVRRDRRSARQQERDEAWALYSQSYRGTPKNEGFPTPSAPAASSDRVIGAQATTIDWAPSRSIECYRSR